MSLDRALALIALALDPAASEEESRTAAVAACRLIAKGKLLNGGGHERMTPPPSKPGEPKEGTWEWWWSGRGNPPWGAEGQPPKPKRPVGNPWGPPPKKAKAPRKNKPEGHHQNPRKSSVGTPESRRAMYRADLACDLIKMGTGKVLCAICHTFIPMGGAAFYWPNRRPFENTVHSGCLW